MDFVDACISAHSTLANTTTYTLVLATKTGSCTLQKRYSDFVALHQALIKETTQSAPPSLPSLPPKVLFGNTADKLIELRKHALQRYLQAFLQLPASSPWRQSFAWRRFAQSPDLSNTTIKPSTPPPTPASVWMDSYRRLLSDMTTLKQLIMSRDVFLGRGETLHAVNAMGQGKKLVTETTQQLNALRQQLDDINSSSSQDNNLSDSERIRRIDLIDNMRNELTTIQKQLTRIPTLSMISSSNTTPPSTLPLPSFPSSSLSTTSASLPPSTTQRTKRVFGSVPASTSTTLNNNISSTPTPDLTTVDNRGLLQYQSTQLAQQDTQLNALASLLHRQKEIGMAMNDELDLQNRLLDEVNDQVDTVDKKLKRAGRNLRKMA